jgi:hypothetical protein
MTPIQAYEKEEEEIEARFRSGEITKEQMEQESRNLWRDYRDAVEEAEERAKESERYNW